MPSNIYTPKLIDILINAEAVSTEGTNIQFKQNNEDEDYSKYANVALNFENFQTCFLVMEYVQSDIKKLVSKQTDFNEE